MIHQFVQFLNYRGPLLPRIPPLVFPTISLAFVVAAFGSGCGGFVFSLFSRAATNHNCKSLTTGNSCPARLCQTDPVVFAPEGPRCLNFAPKQTGSLQVLGSPPGFLLTSTLKMHTVSTLSHRELDGRMIGCGETRLQAPTASPLVSPKH